LFLTLFLFSPIFIEIENWQVKISYI
jgi:hypothetical protein